MRICADENFSSRIVPLIREICLGPDHTFIHAGDIHALGKEDEVWIAGFARDGGEAVVSGDVAILRRHNEIVAICDSGIRLIVFSPPWANQPRHMQAAHAFYWWPHIERVLAASPPRACWKVPWGFVDPKNAIKQVPVDFEGARKKLRKAGRREG